MDDNDVPTCKGALTNHAPTFGADWTEVAHQESFDETHYRVFRKGDSYGLSVSRDECEVSEDEGLAGPTGDSDNLIAFFVDDLKKLETELDLD